MATTTNNYSFLQKVLDFINRLLWIGRGKLVIDLTCGTEDLSGIEELENDPRFEDLHNMPSFHLHCEDHMAWIIVNENTETFYMISGNKGDKHINIHDYSYEEILPNSDMWQIICMRVNSWMNSILHVDAVPCWFCNDTNPYGKIFDPEFNVQVHKDCIYHALDGKYGDIRKDEAMKMKPLISCWDIDFNCVAVTRRFSMTTEGLFLGVICEGGVYPTGEKSGVRLAHHSGFLDMTAKKSEYEDKSRLRTVFHRSYYFPRGYEAITIGEILEANGYEITTVDYLTEELQQARKDFIMAKLGHNVDNGRFDPSHY